MTTVFLNGQFVSLEAGAESPRISVFDASIQHGVGIFETMLGGCARPGNATDPRAWVMLIDEHLERLERSAATLNLASVLHTGPLGDAVFATVAKSGLARARVRLTITGGDLNLLARGQSSGGGGGGSAGAHAPTILIVAQPATAYPAPMLQGGVMATLADTRVSPFVPDEGHKTLNYWWRLRELQAAGAKGAAEAIVFSVTGHVVGGCVSSILLVKNGKLSVPIAKGEEAEVARGGEALPSPVLPGITREWAINGAAGEGVLCTKRMLTINDVLEADEVMLTNSSWGVLPIVKVEQRSIGSGEPGPVTKRLVEAWSEETGRLADLAGA